MAERSETIFLDSESMPRTKDLLAVAEGRTVAFTPRANEAISAAHDYVRRWASEGRVVYGMTTALGDNIRSLIPPRLAAEHACNIIRTHAAGTGPELDEEIVRGIMFLRLACFARGHSGVSPGVADCMLSMLNAGVHPCVPSQGSVGASGDLAPLAHVGLAVIGEGYSRFRGERLRTEQALRAAGIQPFRSLTLKDGLSLINGTSAMTALGGILCVRANTLFDTSIVAAAMSIEALRGSAGPFSRSGNALRPHPGALVVANALHRHLSSGGDLVVTEEEVVETLESQLDRSEVKQASQHRQQVYTLRCLPAFLGAVRDTLDHVARVVEVEVGSVDDNPLVLTDGTPFHGGHFHGQPVAMAMDFLTTALCVLAASTERRAARLLDRTKNDGLPPFLTTGTPGLDYGFQGPQFTCTALVSESRTLAYPASIGSISTNADFQDFVSMGLIAARKAAAVFQNTVGVVAFELLAATQALELRQAEGAQVSSASRAAMKTVRAVVGPLREDRSFTEDLTAVASLICNGQMLSPAPTSYE